jgi:pimeloyl-ACP methyl ester carboxylesterase
MAQAFQPGQTFYDGPSALNETPLADNNEETTQVKSGEMVFLLHGIGKGKMDMAPMARALRKQGYAVVNWHYPSTRYNIADLADKLAAEVGKFPAYKIHFVTHSMGGIVVRTCLSRHPVQNVGRIVMIAPPSQGAELAKFFGDWPLYKFLLGPAGQDLKPADMGKCASAGVPSCEFGIIAGGTGKERGINPLLPGDNDGTVTVASTRLEGEKDFALVPYPHPVIQMMPKTAALTVSFLEHGTFAVDDQLSTSTAKEVSAAVRGVEN